MIRMSSGKIKVGDELIILGKEIGIIRKKIDRMEINHKQVKEVKKGQLLLSYGEILSRVDSGILALSGKKYFKVARRPKVAFFVTGDELQNTGKPLMPGKIRDINRFLLNSQIKDAYAQPLYLGQTKDRLDKIKKYIRKGLESDVLIISGGVSVGDYDYVKPAMRACGIKIKFDKVKIKPGKPTVFGLYQDRVPVFGLPGNPVSTFLSFELFVRPLILKIMHAKNIFRPQILSSVTQVIRNKDNRRTLFYPVLLSVRDGALISQPQNFHGSGDMFSLKKSNAFIVIGPNKVLAKNAKVKTFVWGNIIEG